MKIRIVLTLGILACIAGCTNAPHAIKVLTENGYTDVKITGYKPFSCSESDIFETGFTATAPGGHVVSGVVCEGAFKKSTIRFN